MLGNILDAILDEVVQADDSADISALRSELAVLRKALGNAELMTEAFSAWNGQLNIRDIRFVNGQITGEAGWDCSGYIPLNRDFPVKVAYTAVGVLPTVSLFDIDKNHLATPALDAKTKSVPVSAMPAKAAYFAVSARRDCNATYTNAPTCEGLLHGLSLLLDRLATRHRELDYVVNQEHGPHLELLGGDVGELMTNVGTLMSDASIDRLLDDMWLTEVGSTGGIDRTGHPDAPYLLNGLWLTRSEAVMCLATRRHLSLDNHGFYAGSYIRTNLLPTARCGYFAYSRNCEYLFNGCTYLEVARVSHGSTVFYNSMCRAFKKCSSLHTILGDIDLRANPNVFEMFAGCTSLETVSIVNLSQDISFTDSPSLSTRSIRLMVNNATGTAPVTVTLHGSRYHDYLCANGLPTSAGTPPVCQVMPASDVADWKWIHDKIQEKQITLATATS